MLKRLRRSLTVVGFVVIALLSLLISPSLGTGRINAKMDHLMSMNATKHQAYLAEHPSQRLEFLNSSPDLVADWWHSQDQSDRVDDVTILPKYVGNLEGLDYASRDYANRWYLKAGIAAAKKAVAAEPQNTVARGNLRSLVAIKATISGKRTPRRYLMTLTTSSPPLAAVSVGNVDTANLVTFNVPGMGTFTDDMQAWTQSAQNVWEIQGKVGAPKKRAVVAWIGYVTPPVGIDAALGGYALAGAAKLLTTLDGFRAARSHAFEPHPWKLNVVAHSYGTTTAADALAHTAVKVNSFVMLGSAGIENWIRGASALHAKHVYAGEASQDPEAHWGRLSRQDPRTPGFGARVLSVDGDTARGLRAVTGHAPVLHYKWNDNPLSAAWSHVKDIDQFVAEYTAHENSHGYLDPGTESLRNTAIATTPNPKVPMTGGE